MGGGAAEVAQLEAEALGCDWQAMKVLLIGVR
jgi:hypothetical protein